MFSVSTQIIDICYFICRSQVDMQQYPIIARIEGELKAVPAFIASHPTNQPDCPPELTSR